MLTSQNTLDNDLEIEGRSVVAVARYHRRLQLLLRAIFAVSGQVMLILSSHWSIILILASHWSGREEQTAGTAGVCPEHEHRGDPGAEQQGLGQAHRVGQVILASHWSILIILASHWSIFIILASHLPG